MDPVAIIGGSGFEQLPGLEIAAAAVARTAWGDTAAPLVRGHLRGLPVLFLARHGTGHSLPPHRVNYRANVAALAEAGAASVITLGAVGGIGPDCGPGTLCVPDQLIDYTYGRPTTFYEGGAAGVVHIDFTEPYDRRLRARLLAAAAVAGVPLKDGGTLAVTQGPRLETAAEICRLRRDDCALVGMTAMPEAALARERGLAYATLAFCVNWAAGLADGPITMAAIHRNIAGCRDAIGRLLEALAGSAREPLGDFRQETDHRV
jgi:5'-methylthioadenosine phosphorylase/5'-methylthioinosine phosphorylase